MIFTLLTDLTVAGITITYYTTKWTLYGAYSVGSYLLSSNEEEEEIKKDEVELKEEINELKEEIKELKEIIKNK